MTRAIHEFDLDEDRILVIETDSQDELDWARGAALKKGWIEYVNGTVPGTDKFGVWMRKSKLTNRPDL